MAKWFVAAKKADFDGIARQFKISPVLARIIRNRDIVGEEAIRKYLYGTTEEMYDPRLLPGMDTAVEILLEKIREQKKLRVIGDYDADGICASYILKKGLKACGAWVDTTIPHRIRDGYGLNDQLVQEAAADGVDTIVTCDNGIAAAPQIGLAKQLGMTVVVTDHHEVPYEEIKEEDNSLDFSQRKGSAGENAVGQAGRRYILPPADALIDPKLPASAYPFPEICGALVAYKVIQVLTERLELRNRAQLLEELMEFAAFATVCDVMCLQDENRILVRRGLALMQNSRNIGLRALMEVCGLQPQEKKPLRAFHIGFVLGPCLNASGRLDTAARALQLLECEKREEAVVLAIQLKELNDNRKEMTEYYVRQAIEQIESGPLQNDRVLVVFLPDCHESIAGIIAGRIRERYWKPTFVLTKAEDGVKGSARSIEAYHIYEEMTKCRQFFTKYGGHKMAAGLSMNEADVEAFRRTINALCMLTQEDMQERVHIDVPMPVSYVTMELVEELGRLEPFGTGNPKPVFAQKNLEFCSVKVMGKNANVLRFLVRDDRGNPWEMVYFGNREAFDTHICEKYGKLALSQLYQGRAEGVYLDVVYDPAINTWQGNSRLQLVLQQYQ